MIIYLSIFIVIITSYLCVKKYSISFNINTIFLFLTFYLFFISAFRAEHIGVDHPNYAREFRMVGLIGATYYESGFVYLFKFLNLLNDDPLILSITISGLFIFNFTAYIKKYLPISYCFLCLLIFTFQPYLYIQSTFNSMRQGCAMGVLLFSIPSLMEKKWWKFIFIVFISSTIHSAMIIFVSLIVFRYVNFTEKRIILLSVAFLGMNVLKLGSFAFTIFSKYQGYETYEESVLNNPIYILVILFAIYYLISKYSILYKNETEKFFVDLFLFSLSFLLFAIENDIIYRIYKMFALISIPGIAFICKNLRKTYPIFEVGLVGYYSAFYLGYISLWYIKNDSAYYPFKFIFE